MDRRNFLKTTLGSAVAFGAGIPGLTRAQNSTVSGANATTAPQDVVAPLTKIRGVNLGGWLVLEKWMVPDCYRDTDAPDEYTLCEALGDGAAARLNHHRETFITAADFQWIAQCGLNAVRLPIGYWAIEPPKPFVGATRFIDFALEQAQKHNLKVLLDLHGAPGSQNGWDHSGRSGAINWHKDPANIAETLRVLESFAQKYGQHPALHGIELLNEPRDQVPLEILRQFYQDAYARLRKHLPLSVAIVFHDGFRALAWKKFMQEPQFTNVILDTHLYQCFDETAKQRSAREQIEFAARRKDTLDEMQRDELPTIVGEWSLGLPPRAFQGLSPFQQTAVKRAYADTQLFTYESTRGWFFWSYKLQRAGEWNFRNCVERGWLPASYT